ncbi:unnamed protein product [Clonostachys byssicola]|uniref:Uncharacterized protein n=1 Tax=Clonostachys byssicola TaxID=160290 RepID=A0A9N9UFZ3_9HYPO|nr:unnamed protein product [Clonostachys byssicola]
MAVTLELREPVYPIVPRDSSQLSAEAVKALTTGGFRAHEPEDIANGSPTANAAAAFAECYPVLAEELLDWASKNGALVQRKAETEPLIMTMRQNVFAVPPNRIAIAFALGCKNVCAGAVIAKGMARRAALSKGLPFKDDEPLKIARWMVRTIVDEDCAMDQPVEVRSGQFVILYPGQELYQVDDNRNYADMSVIWTEHQLYADPTPKEESDGDVVVEDLTEEDSDK